jgi:hypothetical protein
MPPFRSSSRHFRTSHKPENGLVSHHLSRCSREEERTKQRRGGGGQGVGQERVSLGGARVCAAAETPRGEPSRTTHSCGPRQASGKYRPRLCFQSPRTTTRAWRALLLGPASLPPRLFAPPPAPPAT